MLVMRSNLPVQRCFTRKPTLSSNSSRDDDLKEAIVTEVKGDDTKITVELMVEVAKTRTTFHVYKNLVTKKDNVVGSTNQNQKQYQRGNSNKNSSGPPGGAQSDDSSYNAINALKGLSGEAKKKAMVTAELCFGCGQKRSICKQSPKCRAKNFKCKLCEKRGHHQNACLNPLNVKKITNETDNAEDDINDESD